MTYLEQFTEDQRELLTSLPYRTGLHIGESDTTGGQDASDAELRAIEAIVTGYVEDFCKSEFVEELMRQTLARRSHWDSWRENLDKVPGEIRTCIELLAAKVDHKQITAFKHNLFEIAMGVALAHREFDPDGPLIDRIKVYSDYYFRWVNAYLKKEKMMDIEEALNISPAEQVAILRLEEALQLDKHEGLEPAPLIEDDAPIPKMGPPPGPARQKSEGEN